MPPRWNRRRGLTKKGLIVIPFGQKQGSLTYFSNSVGTNSLNDTNVWGLRLKLSFHTSLWQKISLDAQPNFLQIYDTIFDSDS